MKSQLPAGVLALLVLAAVPGSVPAQEPEADPGEGDANRATSTITFYGHTFGWGRDTVEGGLPFGPMPANTQYPWGEDDFSIGTDLGCGFDPTGSATGPLHDTDPSGSVPAPDCDAWPLNELYYYTTAGFVQVKSWDEFDYTALHNERGLTKDIHLDTTGDIVQTFYMSADYAGFPVALCTIGTPPGLPEPLSCMNWDPGVHPQWVVEATLFYAILGEYGGEASTPPNIAAVVENGDFTVIAQGASEPQDLVSLDENLPTGEGEVREIVIHLGKPQVDVVPKEANFVMKLEWYSILPTGKGILPQLNWNINGGEFYPNRFTLPVRNAFDVELVYPQFLHNKLLVHAIINTPWGSYDVDPRSVTLEVRTGAGQPVTPQRITQLADYSVAHGGHYRPVNVTWVWDYQAERLRPDQYVVSVTAHNHQHSARSTTEAAFEVLADGGVRVLTLGRSGQQTITEAQLDAVTRGAADLAGAGGASGGEDLQPAQAPSGGAPAGEPNSTPGPGAALLALAALAAILLIRTPRRP